MRCTKEAEMISQFWNVVFVKSDFIFELLKYISQSTRTDIRSMYNVDNMLLVTHWC